MDFEFTHRPGEPPVPLCVVGVDICSGRRIEQWLADGDGEPFILGEADALVAYYASAEIGCFLALGWQIPTNVVDLFAEFRVMTNGLLPPGSSGLLAALRYWSIEHPVDESEKSMMRKLAERGGHYSWAEQSALLAYCATDVDALAKLLPVMAPSIDVPRALLRGRSMVAAARIEGTGVPIDVERMGLLRDNWDEIRVRIAQLANYRFMDVFQIAPKLRALDADQVHAKQANHVDEGAPQAPQKEVVVAPRFSTRHFLRYLRRRGIDWPRLPSGAPKLDGDTFADMVSMHPELRLLRDAKRILSELKLNKLAVGDDGRNRTLLSAFSARTGRNQPSNSQFIFGLPSWLRGLIRPEPGRAIAYIDWEQQEFGIAAALSRDVAMMAAYLSGDPYLAFAIRAGAAPAGATKESHKDVREQYKRLVIATQYLMGEISLAAWLSIPEPYAQDLLRQHRKVFARYWEWSNDVVVTARMRRVMRTGFGWQAHVGSFLDKERSIRNWPIQSCGAEMMRIACILATDAGVRVCAPVHDAMLIESDHDDIGSAVATAQAAMREASELVLDGFALRTDAKVLCHGARYVDSRGAETWREVHRIIGAKP